MQVETVHRNFADFHIRRLQHASRERRTALLQTFQDLLREQEIVIQETNARLAELKAVTKLNDISNLLIVRYKDHEDEEADLEDDKNSRYNRDRRRYKEWIEALEQ